MKQKHKNNTDFIFLLGFALFLINQIDYFVWNTLPDLKIFLTNILKLFAR